MGWLHGLLLYLHLLQHVVGEGVFQLGRLELFGRFLRFPNRTPKNRIYALRQMQDAGS